LFSVDEGRAFQGMPWPRQRATIDAVVDEQGRELNDKTLVHNSAMSTNVNNFFSLRWKMQI
jgi:hypothetical protein